MESLGRYMLGELIPIRTRTADNSDTPTNPSAAPVAVVYNSSGTIVRTIKMPISDQTNVTGWFQYLISLNSNFETGYYDVVVTYTVSATTKVQVFRFEVIAGGDARGTAIGLHYLKHPVRNFCLIQTMNGGLYKARNPRVS